MGSVTDFGKKDAHAIIAELTGLPRHKAKLFIYTWITQAGPKKRAELLEIPIEEVLLCESSCHANATDFSEALFSLLQTVILPPFQTNEGVTNG